MANIVLAGACRTAIGKFGGTLAGTPAVQLGSIVIAEALRRAGIKPADVDEVLIPGLFAAGTDTCNIYGDSYMFLLPGNTMGYCLNTGRFAGESAAKFASENQ